MSGIFGAFGRWLGGTVGDPSQSSAQASAAQIAAMQNAYQHRQAIMDQANALYEKYRDCKPVLAFNSVAFGYSNTATGYNSVAIRPLAPGIYWTQRTNRQSTVEIVR